MTERERQIIASIPSWDNDTLYECFLHAQLEAERAVTDFDVKYADTTKQELERRLVAAGFLTKAP